MTELVAPFVPVHGSWTFLPDMNCLLDPSSVIPLPFCSVVVLDSRVGHTMDVQCTFSISLCPLSFWLTLPRGVLSMSRCCPSRPCVVFLACVHLALFLALSLSPGNSLVSSRCDHSMLASLLWRCLNSSLFTPALLRTHSCVFFAVHETGRIFLSPEGGRKTKVGRISRPSICSKPRQAVKETAGVAAYQPNRRLMAAAEESIKCSSAFCH